jgi:hypothetical protein
MANHHEATKLFLHNFNATAGIVVNQGGSNSGKTFAIIQVLYCKACEAEGQVITVVGQDIPNLKSGALRDALKIYNDSDTLRRLVKSYNKSDRVFEFFNGSIIEFKSYSDAQDAKSGKRDYLFVNEADGIPWDIFVELQLRTRRQVSTASIVASVMTTYFNLKNDINTIKQAQETEAKINNIRLKILEDDVALLQKQIDGIKLADSEHLIANKQAVKSSR